MTIDLLFHYLSQLTIAMPTLSRLAADTRDLRDVAHLLRTLLDEGISVRNLRSLLEILCQDLEPISVDPSTCIVYALDDDACLPAPALGSAARSETRQKAERLRIELKRYIGFKYTMNGNTLRAYQAGLRKLRNSSRGREETRKTWSGCALASARDRRANLG